MYAVWAAWHFPWDDAGRALGDANWWYLGLAVLATVVSVVLRGWEWHLLLSPAAPNRWSSAVRATLVGAAVGNISISVAGEGVRLKFLRDHDGVPTGIGVAAIVWSRVLQGVVGVAGMVIAPFFLEFPGNLQKVHLGAGIVLAIGMLLYLGRRSLPLGRLLPPFARHPVRVMRRIRREGPQIPFAMFLALLYWIAQWTAYHLVLLSSGVHAGLSASAAALVIANLAWLVRFTPGNIGVMQGSIALALLPFGVPAPVAVVAALVLQAVQFLPLLPIAILAVGFHRFMALIRTRGRAPSEQPA